MDCKKCQYHTADGRCLYYIGCPYKPTPNEPTLDDLLEFEAEALGIANSVNQRRASE